MTIKTAVVRVRNRDVFRMDKYRKDKDGKPLQVHVGKETIRKGYCTEHEEWSSRFEGVLAAGWLFRCLGGKAGTKHRFVLEPPK